jgi:glycosyltransferase involved in cell wall biosynthesis
MRILITCDRYLGQKHDGLTLRVVNYLKQLRGQHQFDLLCITPNSAPRNPELDALIDEFIPVQIEPATQAATQAASGIFARIKSAFDINELYLHSTQLQQRINSQCRHKHYDLIWDAGCNMLLNLGDARRTTPILADQVDDAVLALKRQLSVASTLYPRLWLAKQIMLQKQFARQHIANAAAVLFVSEADEASFRRFCPQANTQTIANGVDLEFFTPAAIESSEQATSTSTSTSTAAPPQLIFEGVMSFGPNVDAARYFCADILPAILHAAPETRFSIVGRDPLPEVQALVGPQVEVTGFVTDIRPYLQSSAVFVCPMRMGAGIKNKILQAWAMGMAVVSTPEGAMGLPAIDGENILLRSEPADFAQAALELMQTPNLRERLGRAGRARVEKEFSWASKAVQFEALMRQAAAQRPVGQA